MRIYLSQKIADCGIEFLQKRGYDFVVSLHTDESELIHEVQNYHPDGIIVRTSKISKAVIDASGPQLKVISRHGSGTDNIDVEYAHSKGIIVCNGPYSNTNAVAQHILLMILACAARLKELDHAVINTDWGIRDRLMIIELDETTCVGFIGFGKIGRLTALKLHAAFPDVRILAWSRHLDQTGVPEYVQISDSAETVFKQADFVSLNCPATRENMNLINAETLALMKNSAYLINCARGSLVNEEELYRALKDGQIAGAAIDTLTREPVKVTIPLMELPNVIFTPHCAAHTTAAFNRMAMASVEGIDAVLNGRQPRWVV